MSLQDKVYEFMVRNHELLFFKSEEIYLDTLVDTIYKYLDELGDRHTKAAIMIELYRMAKNGLMSIKTRDIIDRAFYK